MESSRTLVVMRHAAAQPAAASDAERALTDDGRAEARVAGRWLASAAPSPDLALVSAALRTRETWAAVAEAAGWGLEPRIDDGLYSAGPEVALDLVRASPADVATVVLLGHNPTMGFLAPMLDDGDGPPAATTAMAAGFPPAAVAVLTFPGPWTDLDAGAARLAAFHPTRS